MKKLKLAIVSAVAVIVVGAAIPFLLSSPEGKIVNLPVKAEDLPSYKASVPDLAVYAAKLTDSPSTVRAALEKNGYSVKVYDDDFTWIGGFHGDKINVAYSREVIGSSMIADKTITDLKYWRYTSGGGREGVEDPNTYNYRIYHFGDRILWAYYYVRWSEKLKEGPTWQAMADDLTRNMQAQNGWLLRPLLTSSKNGKNSMSFDENGKSASDANAPFSYTLETLSCAAGNGTKYLNPNNDPYLNSEGKPDRVCSMNLSFADQRISPSKSALDLLKQKYIDTFGQPKCWLDADECKQRKIGKEEARYIVSRMEDKARQQGK